jgi:hypothetical protein
LDTFHTLRKFRLDWLKGLKVTAWTKFWLKKKKTDKNMSPLCMNNIYIFEKNTI